MEKILEVFGFRDKPAKWWAWASVVFLVAIFIVTFFLSFSLARHKRQVADLTAKVIEQDAQIKVRNTQLKKKDEEMKLALLKKDSKQDKKRRKESRTKIAGFDKKLEKNKAELKNKRKALNKDSNAELIRKSKELVSDTF